MGDNQREDPRPPMLVVRQYKELEQIRQRLIRQGHLDEDASAEEVIECLRKRVPVDLFGNAVPPTH